MCLSPVSIRVQPSDHSFSSYYIQAPCCKCVECVIERQNAWKLRLCEEAGNWRNTYFFTLTYRDRALPTSVNTETGEVISTACKKDVQSWLKVMRERYQRSHGGERMEFKYFICAEYGPGGEYFDDRGRVRQSTKRPHYHGLLFTNCDRVDVVPVFREWSKVRGHVDFHLLKPTKAQPDLREHRSKVANYVSKYCCKGEFASRVDDIEAGYIEPAWTLVSKGIGRSYVDRMKSHHLCNIDFSDLNVPTSIDEITSFYYSDPDRLFWKFIDEIIERRCVYDGSYRYKMPRYYQYKIYGYKKTSSKIVVSGPDVRICDQPFSQSGLHGKFVRPSRLLPVYGSEEVDYTREAFDSFIPLAIRFRLQLRSDVKFMELLQKIRKEYPSYSDSDVAHEAAARKAMALQIRRKNAYKRQASWYQSAQLANPTVNFM